MSALLLALDVHYEAEAATTAAVGFAEWTDAHAQLEWVERREGPLAPYQPGEFFRRELPSLLDAVQRVLARRPVATLLVDGHVWLDGTRPGLGAHLFDAFEGRYPVIGVAKSAFRAGVALPVLRGHSQRPLFVSAAGVDPAWAAEQVRRMAGPHRIPAVLSRVDRLARARPAPDHSIS